MAPCCHRWKTWSICHALPRWGCVVPDPLLSELYNLQHPRYMCLYTPSVCPLPCYTLVFSWSQQESKHIFTATQRQSGRLRREWGGGGSSANEPWRLQQREKELMLSQTLWPSRSESRQPVDKQSSRGTQRLVTEMLFPVTSMVCWV